MEDTELVIQSFSMRPDEFFEVTFIEKRDQGKNAGLVKTVVIDPSLLRKEDLSDMFDTITDFINVAMRHIRTGEVDSLD